MRKIILFMLLFSFTKTFAQDFHCATDVMMNSQFKKNPSLKSTLVRRSSMRMTTPPHVNSSATYTIPVVFHILHLNGPENIPDSQVVDAMRILNLDYAKLNPDISEVIPSFQSIADSTKIQFALATVDPFGNCTNGIVHYYDTDADWNEMSSTLFSHTWDPTMYMNVYIVRTITLNSGFGAAGYTFFPGTWGWGDPMDAIVVLNNYFGSVGTGSAFLSRVLTHEVGHWFGLYHVFGFNSAGVDCSGDDYINDTPTTPGYLLCPDANDPPSYQLCMPGVDENFQNFMDYSYCCRMFTHDQALSMQTSLNDPIVGRDNLWSASNLLATGITGPGTACVPIADFTYDRSVTCVNVPVTFHDASWNGQPVSLSWSFPSGNPSTSTDASPSVTYSTPGTYSATLTTSNVAGSSLPVTKTNIITVGSNTTQYNGAWFEGFEGSQIPNNDWTVTNTSGGPNWQQSWNAPFSGTFSAMLDATGNTRISKTYMTGPSINLSQVSDPVLTFQVAATEINLNHINTLQVQISTDCEQTWETVYSRTGMNLITTIDTAVPFMPYMQSQWRLENIPLTPWQAAASARLRFVYLRDTLPSPSNIYVDDINVQSTTGIESASAFGMKFFPSPVHDKLFISGDGGSAEVVIYNVPGERVMSRPAMLYMTQPASLDVSNLVPGIYFVEVKSAGKVLRGKFVKE